MAKRLGKFVDEFIVGNRQTGWCAESRCKELPITRRVHAVRGKIFRQYFVPNKKYLNHLDGFPTFKLAIQALRG